MLNVLKSLRLPVFAAMLATMPFSIGCHAQPPAASAAGTPLTPELHRRIEILIRTKLNVPPDYTLTISPRSHSEIPGFDSISVIFTQDGKSSHPNPFLVSTDGKTLAQFNTFDISKDPRATVSDAGRPARGGSESAPVTIVAFDDLECPFCARMHAALFPAMLDRYKDNVRIVYRDFPLSQHPWATHAAVDVNCLASQSPSGYWSLVDYVHAHASELGGADKSVDKANTELDTLTLDEGKRDKINTETLAACVKKQDASAVEASLKLGEGLNIEATPVLFINGEKLEGAYPVGVVFRMIDEALVAAGKTPPPPYVAPASAPAPATTQPSQTPTPTPKPGT